MGEKDSNMVNKRATNEKEISMQNSENTIMKKK
jgi:hypothetical protein